MRTRSRFAIVAIAAFIFFALLGGCADILGLSSFIDQCPQVEQDKPCPDAGSGAGGASTGTTTAASGGGAGGDECHSSADCMTDTTCVSASCDATHQCLSTNAMLGATCADHGGSVCDGAGTCVECNVTADCTTGASTCRTATSCTAHKCSFDNAPVATACTDSGGNACDGKGHCIGAVSLAAGFAHTCAVTTLGGVKCWGDNSFGDLGDGTTTQAIKPVDVSTLDSGVKAVTAGVFHSCALTATGGVKCWGSNFVGQLGNGTTTDSSTPVDVLGLSSGVTAIAAGGANTCAITSGGGVKCWGGNKEGDLGNGTTTDSHTPVDVTNLTSGIQAIAFGGDHGCALDSTGAVSCWGYNAQGQLGDLTTTNRTTPVSVFLDQVAAIAAGQNHTCAVLGTTDVVCWGDNVSGDLGDGTTTAREIPTAVSGLSSAATAACGYSHSCVLTKSGSAKCWGLNSSGQLGNQTMTNSLIPVVVEGLAAGAAPIVAGEEHTCVIGPHAAVECWGDNSVGQLGDGTVLQRTTPVAVFGL